MSDKTDTNDVKETLTITLKLDEAQADALLAEYPDAESLAMLDNWQEVVEICEKTGCPVSRANAKKVFAHFCGQKQSTATAAPAATAAPVAAPAAPAQQITVKLEDDDPESMNNRDLLAKYDPDADNKFAREIDRRANGQPCIVFVRDTKAVDLDASVTCMEELREGEKPRDSWDKDRGVYRVGQKPGQVHKRNPLFPEERLRRDGTCNRTKLKWEAAGDEARALVHYGVLEGDLPRNMTTMAAKPIVEMANANNLDGLRDVLPKATNRLRKEKEAGQGLPNLNMPVDGQGMGTGSPVLGSYIPTSGSTHYRT